MNQKTRMLVTMAAFLLLAGGAGAWAYWGVFEAQREEEARDDEARRLLRVEAEAIERLEVTTRGRTTVVQREGEGWRIVEPVQAQADRAAVEGLIDRLASARRKRALEETDPAKFGLAPPQVVVAVVDEAGARSEVALGKANAFDGSLFVRDDQGAIGTADSTLRGALDQSTFDLRDKRLVVVGQDAIAGLELSGEVALVREAEGWFIDRPVRERADDPTVDGIVRALQDLRATDFAAEEPSDPAAFGLAEPAYHVEVRRKDGDPIRLAFGEVDGKVYARAGEGPVAELPSNALDPIRKKLDELRDRRLVSFDSKRASRLRVKGGEEELVLEKVDDDWRLTAPKEAKAKRWRVTSLLSTFSSLRADRLAPAGADPAAYDLEEPARIVVALDAEGKELGRLEVGRKDPSETWVRAAGSTRIAAVDNTRLSHLLPALADVEEVAADVAAAGAAKD